MIKTLEIEGNLLNMIKDISEKLTANNNKNSVVKDWKLFPQDQEQDKDIHFHHCYSTLY